MPIFDFKCPQCGLVVENKLTVKQHIDCLQCEGVQMQKLPSATNVINKKKGDWKNDN